MFSLPKICSRNHRCSNACIEINCFESPITKSACHVRRKKTVKKFADIYIYKLQFQYINAIHLHIKLQFQYSGARHLHMRLQFRYSDILTIRLTGQV